MIPSLTVSGKSEAFGWGAQTRYRFASESRNESGFRFGNRLDANVWLTKPLGPAFALNGRVALRDEGRIRGHYNGPHNHNSPPDLQENYGGTMIEAGLGGNLVVDGKWRLGAEGTIPIYQNLNGIQAPKRFGVNLNVSRMF